MVYVLTCSFKQHPYFDLVGPTDEYFIVTLPVQMAGGDLWFGAAQDEKGWLKARVTGRKERLNSTHMYKLSIPILLHSTHLSQHYTTHTMYINRLMQWTLSTEATVKAGTPKADSLYRSQQSMSSAYCTAAMQSPWSKAFRSGGPTGDPFDKLCLKLLLLGKWELSHRV